MTGIKDEAPPTGEKYKLRKKGHRVNIGEYFLMNWLESVFMSSVGAEKLADDGTSSRFDSVGG